MYRQGIIPFEFYFPFYQKTELSLSLFVVLYKIEKSITLKRCLRRLSYANSTLSLLPLEKAVKYIKSFMEKQ